MPPPIIRERNLRGVDEVRRNIGKCIKEFPKVVIRAAKAEMEIEKRESQKITPYQTGKLHDSHEIIGPEIVSGGSIHTGLAAGIYDGVELDYAVPVHEDLEAFHPHGQAKFLEETWNAAAPHLAKRISVRININDLLK